MFVRFRSDFVLMFWRVFTMLGDSFVKNGWMTDEWLLGAERFWMRPNGYWGTAEGLLSDAECCWVVLGGQNILLQFWSHFGRGVCFSFAKCVFRSRRPQTTWIWVRGFWTDFFLHIDTYTLTHTYTHLHTLTHTHTHTYTYIHTHTHAHTHTYAHIHTHTYTYTCIYTSHTHITYIYTHTHTHEYTHTQQIRTNIRPTNLQNIRTDNSTKIRPKNPTNNINQQHRPNT